MYGNASMYLFAIIAINIKKELIKKKAHQKPNIKLDTSKLNHPVNRCKPIVNHTTTFISNN
jgi:hypothetical protein